jgi:sugar phosphate isomerase/epimerase
MEHISWNEFGKLAKQAGFDGIEVFVPFDEQEKKELVSVLKENELLLIGQYYQSFEKDFELHKDSFKKHLQHLASVDPLLIDSQTGKDYFTSSQNGELFSIASDISKNTGVPIAHETHRNKALFAAHIAGELLMQNPNMHITADFSHWCVVSESLLEQQEDAVALAVKRAIHIHARVGSSQSAQVTDPRAPEWQNELETHLHWWEEIFRFRRSIGAKLFSITTEFGPPPYMVSLPFSGQPLADQWEINMFMKELMQERFKKIIY